ncbi:phage shock protein PspC (stress-responsive transcriptional regulator) [Geodermatophilus bullaregiensis]|uniref:PspC domain-containing protein n=1 Tax=Geodermatophilus bullaregiensis TaxID=1564160 RepID=UPI00195E8C8E|nr:PspC domain-containing protein [Geodermatophilus bullaregiensis]MBM7805910.1 phage shock protein PspC (stress-responsive transcriptional regulator) [Geodermatophilus bullaregiensis]
MTAAPPPAPLTEPPPVARSSLRRSRTDKVVGGVAGGLAEYSGIDALLWRVGFVALTVAGGSGVLVYLLLWLLMPAGPRRPVDGAPAQPPGPRSPVAGITVAGLLIAVGLLVLVTRYTDLDLGPTGVLATALLVVGLGLVGSSFARGRSPRRGLIAVGAVLSVALLFASAVPWTDGDDDDFGGGVGDRTYRPTSVAEVDDVYRLGAGDLDVDLSEIGPGDRDRPLEVRIEHGAGDLDVTVPGDADVRIDVESGIGEVDLLGRSDGGLFRAPGGDGDADLVLTIEHGVGDVEVSRA